MGRLCWVKAVFFCLVLRVIVTLQRVNQILLISNELEFYREKTHGVAVSDVASDASQDVPSNNVASTQLKNKYTLADFDKKNVVVVAGIGSNAVNNPSIQKRSMLSPAINYKNINSTSASSNVAVNSTISPNISSGINGDTEIVRPTRSDKSIKLLWSIISDPSQVELRQAIRDTYLKEDGIDACSINDSTIENKSSFDQCEIVYSFFLTQSSSNTTELDCVVLDLGSVGPDMAWLQRASKLLEQWNETDVYVVRTNTHTLESPRAVMDQLRRLEENPYRSLKFYPDVGEDRFDAYLKDSPLHLFGASQADPNRIAQDNVANSKPPRRLASRKNSFTGEFMIMSKDFAKALVDVPNITHGCSGNTLFERISSCYQLVQNIYPVEYVAKFAVVATINKVWDKRQKNRQAWKDLSKNLGGAKFHAMSGKFGYRPGFFRAQVLLQRDERLAHGLDPEQISAYDTFPPRLVRNKTFAKHFAFLYDRNETRASRGGGYWFWKPYIILDALERVDDGDFVLYNDVDFTNFANVREHLASMHANGHDMSLFSMHCQDRDWTKRDTYVHFCGKRNQTMDMRDGYQAGNWFLRKTPGVVRFMRAWADEVTDYHLLSDEPSVERNIATFRQHRHDQSMASLLLKCRYGKSFEKMNSTFIPMCKGCPLRSFRIE